MNNFFLSNNITSLILSSDYILMHTFMYANLKISKLEQKKLKNLYQVTSDCSIFKILHCSKNCTNFKSLTDGFMFVLRVIFLTSLLVNFYLFYSKHNKHIAVVSDRFSLYSAVKFSSIFYVQYKSPFVFV